MLGDYFMTDSRRRHGPFDLWAISDFVFQFFSLFSPLSKLADRAIYINFFLFSWSVDTNYLRIYRTDFHDFSPNERYLFVLSWSGPLFSITYKRCHANRLLAKFAKLPSFSTLAFRNGFEYRNSQFRFTLVQQQYFCYILCKFYSDRSTNPEIMQGVSVTFRTSTQKSTYLTKYLSK